MRKRVTDTSSINGWRSAIAEIDKLDDYRRQYGDRFDDLDYGLYQDDRKAIIQEWRNVIVDGLLAEFNGAIDNYKKAQGKIRQEFGREVARWSPRALTDERNYILARMQDIVDRGEDVLGDGPPIGAQLSELYNEMAVSENRNQRRAVFEVFSTALSKVPETVDVETRMQTNRLQAQAVEDLQDIRLTGGMMQAEADKQASWASLLEKRAEVVDVSAKIGENVTDPFAGGPLAKSIRRVRTDGTILPEDHPEVSGIVWRTPPETITVEKSEGQR